jgi:hypothetical protein
MQLGNDKLARSALTNQTPFLSLGLDMRSREARRLRDLYQAAAKKIGGQLDVEQRVICANWARAQYACEVCAGDVLGTALSEQRRAWAAVLRAAAARRGDPERRRTLTEYLAEHDAAREGSR